MQVGAVGIDFGSTRSVIAVAKKGGVDVLANEGSHRETTNIVGYTETERFVGEQASQQQKSNFKNTVKFFNRLLGIPADYPNLRNETKWLSSKTATNGDNRLVHQVSYQGQQAEFLPEQVTATMIGKIKQIIESNNIANKEAVVSCPSYYTEPERKALLDACKIADLKCVRLYNESTAIALSYGLFRKSELDPTNPRNVVFVDFGHSKTSIFLGQFTQSKGKVLSQKHDRHLGVRDIDWILLQKYDEIFQSQSGGLSLFESKKAQIRLFDAIEKQRKVLSANMEAPINLEYLMEDCDFNHITSREDFEKLAAPVIERFQENLKLVAEEIANRKLDIHSIELVGGGTRIPIVQKAIFEVFGKECNRTLNASECIARGCAMESAYRSPLFNVAPYEIEDSYYYQVKMGWLFQRENPDGMEEEAKKSLLFKKGDVVPTVKSLTFQRSDPIDMSLYYDPAPEGIPAEIARINIKQSKPKEKEFSIKARIKMSEHGLISLADANLIEDYQVEEKIKKEKPKQPEKPAEKPADKPADENQMKEEKPQDNTGEKQEEKPKEEDEYEIKIKKKTRHTQVPADSSTLHQLSKKQIDDFTLSEATMLNQDRAIQETKTRKNELESAIYTYRDQINGIHKDFTQPDIIPKINTLLQETEDWLYGEGENANKSKYIEKKKALDDLCQPPKNRFIEFENLPSAYQDFDRGLQQLEGWAMNTQEEKYAHIGKEDRDKVMEECAKARNWIKDCQSKMQNHQKWQEPIITVDAVYKNLKNAQDASQPIINKPKPEPKKEEKKEENKDKPAEQQPTEEQSKETKPEKMDVEVD